MSQPINLDEILQLQANTVARWHDEDIDNPYTGLQSVICTQHSFNFQLWHEEDIARSPDVSDAEIARVKRSIDRFNQQRNDWIEKVDDEIIQLVASQGTPAADDAPLNTELQAARLTDCPSCHCGFITFKNSSTATTWPKITLTRSIAS